MKNYFEHEEEVHFVDDFLAKSQEWQWFIDCVESNFDLDDISSYSDFKNRNIPLRRILDKIIKIINVCDKKLIIHQKVLQDIYDLALYYVGADSISSCCEKIETNMGKLLLVVIWMTKLENVDNETDYIVDMRFLSLKNLYQAINMQSIDAEADNIIDYLEKIELDGAEASKKCVIDNIYHKPYGITDGFFEKYGNYFLSSNAFDFQTIQKDEYLTWQEQVLLDMISISIDGKKIVPIYKSGNNSMPDYSGWTIQNLNHIQEYFNNPISDFVIESINYVKNGVCPGKTVIIKHCKLLEETIKANDEFEVTHSSTFKILSELFSDGLMKNLSNEKEYIDFIIFIHQIDSIHLLLRFSKSGFPLSKEQRDVVKKYIFEQYKRIDEIKEIHELLDYFRNKDIAKHITQEYYDKIIPTFNKVLNNDPRQEMLPTLFYYAMLFLLELNQTNQYVDKRNVKNAMIGLQELWQNKIFAEQCNNLQKFTYSSTVSSKDVNLFNEIIIANPSLIAQKCLMTNKDELFDAMNMMSENSIAYAFKKMILSPIFPQEGAKVNLEKHDIDVLLTRQVEDIKERCGYKFLNNLETKVFVSGIHERYRLNASMTIPMFTEEKKLYSIIEELSGFKLIPYNDEISLGHLTQLFPLLEINIRSLGKMFGIVPFKEKVNEFMKFKDPSSILCDLLESIYNELGSFENASDLLFVYNFMYNGNSLNIRNECIHGRDYISGNQLKYAFKITELSLYMILYRIEAIKENIFREGKNK